MAFSPDTFPEFYVTFDILKTIIYLNPAIKEIKSSRRKILRPNSKICQLS